ncbi:hypothetical protein [Treponema sp. R6D11]
MTRDEFLTEYKKTSERVFALWEMARKHGLLVLEKILDPEKINNRDILDYGLLLSLDLFNSKTIDRILSLIIEKENDKYTRQLMKLKKEAVLQLCGGTSPHLLNIMLNAYTEIPLECDPVSEEIFEKNIDITRREMESLMEVNYES